MNKEIVKTKLQYSLFCLVQGVLGIAPIIIYILIKWDKFFGNKNSCVSNALGLVVAIIFLVLIFTKQTKILKGIGGFIIFAIIVTLMKTVISELYIISWCGVGGMVLSTLFNTFFTDTIKIKLDAIPNQIVSSQNTNKIVQAINGRG